MNVPIHIVPGSEAEAQLWRTTAEIARLFADWPWVLVGGLMVAILEREHGVTVSRTTVDVDALIDVRAVTQATRRAALRLEEAGFGAEQTADGLAYRFIRGDDIVDVLAPDHLGSRTDIVTAPPGRTLEAVGGRQALERRRVVVIDVAGEVFSVPVPSLLGGIIIKARVCASSNQEKHRRDLARLLALVGDVEPMRQEMSSKERSYLRARSELRDPRHPAWRGGFEFPVRFPLEVPRAVSNVEDAIIALERLSAP